MEEGAMLCGFLRRRFSFYDPVLGGLAVKAATMIYEGKVRGQGRPRFRRNGKAYETAQDRAYKKALAEAYKEQSGVWFGDAELVAVVEVERALPI